VQGNNGGNEAEWVDPGEKEPQAPVHACAFAYDASLTPEVDGVSPMAFSAGDNVTITGSNFGTDKTKIEVTIGGSPAPLFGAWWTTASSACWGTSRRALQPCP